MLLSLPPEVIFHVASFLDLSSLFSLAGTCAMFTYLSDSSTMFCTSFFNKWQFLPPNHAELLEYEIFLCLSQYLILKHRNNLGEMLKWNQKLLESKTLLEGNQNFIVFMVQNGKIIGDSLNNYKTVNNHKNAPKDPGGGVANHVDLRHAPWDIIFVFSKKKMAYMNDFGVCIQY